MWLAEIGLIFSYNLFFSDLAKYLVNLKDMKVYVGVFLLALVSLANCTPNKGDGTGKEKVSIYKDDEATIAGKCFLIYTLLNRVKV